MPIRYRIVDLMPGVDADFDVIVEGARSPEDAVRQGLGIDVVRSGASKDLAAEVHWQTMGRPTNSVRLYTRSSPDGARPKDRA